MTQRKDTTRTDAMPYISGPRTYGDPRFDTWCRRKEVEALEQLLNNAEFKIETLQRRLKAVDEAGAKAQRFETQARTVMEAAASMAGKHWLLCQVALAEFLDGKGGDNLNWLLSEYEAFRKNPEKREEPNPNINPFMF